jgi:hypothetical protein
MLSGKSQLMAKNYTNIKRGLTHREIPVKDAKKWKT